MAPEENINVFPLDSDEAYFPLSLVDDGLFSRDPALSVESALTIPNRFFFFMLESPLLKESEWNVSDPISDRMETGESSSTISADKVCRFSVPAALSAG